MLLGFLEAVAVGLDVDDLGTVNEPVDERDDAGGVGKDLAPASESLVGAEQERLLRFVATCDDLEQEIGVAAVVGARKALEKILTGPMMFTPIDTPEGRRFQVTGEAGLGSVLGFSIEGVPNGIRTRPDAKMPQDPAGDGEPTSSFAGAKSVNPGPRSPGGDRNTPEVGPRAALVEALTAAIARATATGDLHAARVAYAALGRLLPEPDGSPVADLASERVKRQLKP